MIQKIEWGNGSGAGSKDARLVGRAIQSQTARSLFFRYSQAF
jgi:hypothetical protein